MSNLDIKTHKFILEEADTINPLLARLNRLNRPPVTINHEVTRWSWFVGRLEQGVITSLDEYIGYLETRDLLAQIIEIVPASAREKLVPFIEEWDKRFEEATIEIGRPVSPGENRQKWWTRIPKNTHENLQADLRAKKLS